MTLSATLGPMWRSFAEIDVRAIREEVQLTPRLALVGARDKTSAMQRFLQHGPHSDEHLVTAVPTYHLPLDALDLAALGGYDLRVVLLDDDEPMDGAVLDALLAQSGSVLLVQDPVSLLAVAVDAAATGQSLRTMRLLRCSLDDAEAVRKELLPAIVQMLPRQELSAGRAYPGLRPAVANKLIQGTSRVNAGYAAGTGVAALVPGLGIPFAMADIIILTKNQVVMAYKLSLLMGESGSLPEFLPKIAGVVGAGFMWRQVARELVGFLPLGVVLKTGVAYAGTYATGQAVYHYFVTGEKLSKQDLRRLFDEAAARGREFAVHTIEQVQARREKAALRAADGGAPARKRVKLPTLGKRKPV